MVQQTNFFLPCFLLTCGSVLLLMWAAASWEAAQGPLGAHFTPPPTPGPSAAAPATPAPAPPIMVSLGAAPPCPGALCRVEELVTVQECRSNGTLCRHATPTAGLCQLGTCDTSHRCRVRADGGPQVAFACECRCPGGGATVK